MLTKKEQRAMDQLVSRYLDSALGQINVYSWNAFIVSRYQSGAIEPRGDSLFDVKS